MFTRNEIRSALNGDTIRKEGKNKDGSPCQVTYIILNPPEKPTEEDVDLHFTMQRKIDEMLKVEPKYHGCHRV